LDLGLEPLARINETSRLREAPQSAP